MIVGAPGVVVRAVALVATIAGALVLGTLVPGSRAWALGLPARFEPPAMAATSDPAVRAPSRSSLAARPNLVIAAAGGALTWLALQRENAEGMARALDDSPVDGLADLGNVYGDGRVLAAATVGVWLAGRAARDANLSRAGGEMARSLAVSSVLVWAIKAGVRRERPDGGSFSFPSGHTAVAFSVAPVVRKRLGWKAAAPAYTLATMTAIGRMEERKHYLSDVLFGATLGLIVGEAIARTDAETRFPGHIAVGRREVGLAFGF